MCEKTKKWSPSRDRGRYASNAWCMRQTRDEVESAWVSGAVLVSAEPHGYVQSCCELLVSAGLRVLFSWYERLH